MAGNADDGSTNGTENPSPGKTVLKTDDELRKDIEKRIKDRGGQPGTASTTVELDQQEQNIYGTLGAEIGLNQEKNAPSSKAIPDKPDPYQWLERTTLTDEEIRFFRDEIALAEHGIGGELLDIPLPDVAEDVVIDLRARRSRTGELVGQSSQRFENEMTAWVRWMTQKEEEAKKAAQKGIAG